MNKRELIIQKAIVLFAERGYYGVGLTELLKKCEVPKGSFYHYFPEGKIQLIQETLQAAFSSMTNHIKKEFFTDGITCYESFEKMLDHLSRGVTEERNYGSLLMTMIAIESRYLGEEVNQTCSQLYTQWQKLYEDHLTSYGYEKKVCLEKSHMIFTMIHCSLITSWIKKDATDLDKLKPIIKRILEE